MFRGITREGIKEELDSTLTWCAALARRSKGRQSLAIPETATFRLAKRSLLSEIVEDCSFILMNPTSNKVHDKKEGYS